MDDRRLVLGVDLGGTKLRTALAHGETIVAELTRPTIAADGGQMVDQIDRAVDELADQAGETRASIVAAGISLPVTLDPGSGRLGSTHNVPGLAGIDFRAELSRALAIPVVVDNDANLAALGEGWRGAAVGVEDYVAIAIGTGIGMGIVAGGRLIRGAHGAAGEIGFLPLAADPFDPQSRISGAYERAVAGPAVRARIDAAIERAGARGAATALLAGAMLADVAAASRQGDQVAVDLLDEEARLVALGIAAIGAILDPRLVILSGGVGSVEGLTEPVRDQTARLLERPPDIRPGLLGERAPLDGALRIALDLSIDR